MKQYYIKINNKFIPVEEEIYRAYYQPLWREEKREEVREDREISYDFLVENGAEPEDEGQERTDDLAVANVLLERRLKHLHRALDGLEDEEKFLISEIFFNGVSERELSDKIDVPRKTLSYRKQNILGKLKKIIENS